MSALLSSRTPSSKLKAKSLENQLLIPLLLRPLVRAYVLGYASSTGPRLISLILRHLNKPRKREIIGHGEGQSQHGFLNSSLTILRGGLELQRFPTSCAVLAGGSTILQIPVRRLLERFMSSLSSTVKARLSQTIATFISAYLALALLQSKKTPEYVDYVPPNTSCKRTGKTIRTTFYGGRTLDLTLFAFTRALDIVIGSLWKTYTSSRPQTRVLRTISCVTDPIIFSISSTLIMWSYFYLPDRLPRNYQNWITTAANVDPRLLSALRLCHTGGLNYGQYYPPNAPGTVLQDMCKEYGWPVEWGDTSKTVPFPCEIVHMHDGPNCEYHAFSRLVRSFIWALKGNLSLNLLLILRKPSQKSLKRAIINSFRSSGFLAAFIALFYYGVCLSRTRCQQFGPTRKLTQRLIGIKTNGRNHPDFQLTEEDSGEDMGSTPSSRTSPGSTTVEIEINNQAMSSPLLPSPKTTTGPSSDTTKITLPTPQATTISINPLQKLNPDIQIAQAIDSGFCVLSGCILCGPSILVEGSRRGELALFVLPRALRTLWNKRYGKEREWVERLVFAGSAVVVVMGVLEGVGAGAGAGVGSGGSLGGVVVRGPRGVFGRVVGEVLKA